MAIENVIMMDVVGKIEDVDKFTKDMFLFNDIQIVDAMHEIETGRFILPIREENINELLGFSQLVSGEMKMGEKNYLKLVNKLNELYKGSLKLDMRALAKGETDLEEALKKVDAFENNIVIEYDEMMEINAQIEKLKQSRVAYSYIDEMEVQMGELDSLENYSYSIGSVTKDNAVRLKSIYNSVTSIVFHVGNQEDNEEVFLIISPRDFEIESRRILKALNYKLIEDFSPEYTGSPGEILRQIDRKISELQASSGALLKKVNAQLEESRAAASASFNTLSLYENLNTIKK